MTLPYNGTGTFQRVYSWLTDQAAGVLVRADRMDTDTNDIASGLSNCMTRDGQSPPTASIPMGAQKITGLANGVAPQDAVTHTQVFDSPTITAPSATASPAAGDSSTLLATTAFAMGMTSPAFVGTPTAPTAAVGTSTTQLATTAFATTLAFSTALPAQTGNSGKYVSTNGTVAAWTALPAATFAMSYSLYGAM